MKKHPAEIPKAKTMSNKSLMDFKNCPSGEFFNNCCTKNKSAIIDRNSIINVIIII